MAGAYRQLKGFRVYCDESKTDSHKPHPVYGAILVSPDNIRTVQREIRDWRHREGMHGELKWAKVDGVTRSAQRSRISWLRLPRWTHADCT